MHAADAGYHQDCKTFFRSKYVKLLASKASETLEVDTGLESVKKPSWITRKKCGVELIFTVCTERAVVLNAAEEL